MSGLVENPRPRRARGIEVGWFGGMTAVRDALECAREVVEILGTECTADFTGCHRWPVGDRTAVAEPEQPGSESQAERAVEIAVAFSLVGRAFERARVLERRARESRPGCCTRAA